MTFFTIICRNKRPNIPSLNQSNMCPIFKTLLLEALASLGPALSVTHSVTQSLTLQTIQAQDATLQDLTRAFKILQDPSRSFKILQDPARPFKILQNVQVHPTLYYANQCQVIMYIWCQGFQAESTPKSGQCMVFSVQVVNLNNLPSQCSLSESSPSQELDL